MEQKKEMIFTQGVNYYSASGNAPAHIIGDVEIWDVNAFMAFVKQNTYQDGDKWKIRLSIKRPSSDPVNGKPYMHVSDYRPPKKDDGAQNTNQQPAPQHVQTTQPQQEKPAVNQGDGFPW